MNRRAFFGHSLAGLGVGLMLGAGLYPRLARADTGGAGSVASGRKFLFVFALHGGLDRRAAAAGRAGRLGAGQPRAGAGAQLAAPGALVVAAAAVARRSRQVAARPALVGQQQVVERALRTVAMRIFVSQTVPRSQRLRIWWLLSRSQPVPFTSHLGRQPRGRDHSLAALRGPLQPTRLASRARRAQRHVGAALAVQGGAGRGRRRGGWPAPLRLGGGFPLGGHARDVQGAAAGAARGPGSSSVR